METEQATREAQFVSCVSAKIRGGESNEAKRQSRYAHLTIQFRPTPSLAGKPNSILELPGLHRTPNSCAWRIELEDSR